MSKKTVAQLDEELQALKHDSGNVMVSQFTLWNWEQVAVELEKYNRYHELIKMEITNNALNGVDKYAYNVTIWHKPLLNENIRNSENGDYYAMLKKTKVYL